MKKKNVSELGERLYLLMKRNGIKNQHQLAVKTGIEYRVINHYFTGRAMWPSRENIAKLSKVLNVHPCDLLFGEEKSIKLSNQAQQLVAKIEKYGDNALRICNSILEFFDKEIQHSATEKHTDFPEKKKKAS